MQRAYSATLACVIFLGTVVNATYAATDSPIAAVGAVEKMLNYVVTLGGLIDKQVSIENRHLLIEHMQQFSDNLDRLALEKRLLIESLEDTPIDSKRAASSVDHLEALLKDLRVSFNAQAEHVHELEIKADNTNLRLAIEEELDGKEESLKKIRQVLKASSTDTEATLADIKKNGDDALKQVRKVQDATATVLKTLRAG